MAVIENSVTAFLIISALWSATACRRFVMPESSWVPFNKATAGRRTPKHIGHFRGGAEKSLQDESSRSNPSHRNDPSVMRAV